MSNRNRIRDHGTTDKQLFARVPNGLARDYELSAMAKAVALEVWSHDTKWQQSMKEIATRLKTGRRQVSNAFAELEAHGWLVREIIKADRRGHPAVEVWHRNLSNEPFSARQVEALRGIPCAPEAQVHYPQEQPTCSPQVQVPCAPEAQHSSETSSETTSEKNLYPTGTGHSPTSEISARDPFALRSVDLPVNTAEEQTQGSAMKAEENVPTCSPGAQVTCTSAEQAPHWDVTEHFTPWPSGKPLPDIRDPFTTYVDAETGEPISA
ncbi:helix-turn-helix domain-containing protein [Mycobacterium avium]|uniref:helix-turn-helix domain-containing protein n=1 Tax=Mycobacterium avium TaxID=1764 RepID=UPI0009BD3F15|nr:helix-turn-helix domain-containing protein [Mycobacterium avium]